MSVPTNERPEVRVFFGYVHKLIDDVAKEHIDRFAHATGAPSATLLPLVRELCEQAVYGVFLGIDRMAGPPNMPIIELRMQDGSLFNADFLHKLYFDYKP